MLESQKEVEHILLSPLMKLGLASVLVNLLTFEMSKLTNDRIPERYYSTYLHRKSWKFSLKWNESWTVNKLISLVPHAFMFEAFKITHLIQLKNFGETDLTSICFPTSWFCTGSGSTLTEASSKSNFNTLPVKDMSMLFWLVVMLYATV